MKQNLLKSNCPFCGSPLYFEQENGLFTCFSCFKTGDANDKRFYTTNQLVMAENSIPVNEAAAEYWQSKLTECKYFKSRKISADTAKTFKIGYAAGGLCQHLKDKGFTADEIIEAGLAKMKDGVMYDVFFKRLMFPIFNANGIIVGFGGRKVDNESPAPKYLNTADTEYFDKKYNLYGIQDVDNYEHIYLVEGYMDVVSLHQKGILNSVAALGTAVGPKHTQLLKSLGTKKVTICLDSDEAGTTAALRAINILKDVFEVDVLQVPGGKDPDEYINKNSAEAFRNLGTISWQKFKIAHQGFNIDILTSLV